LIRVISLRITIKLFSHSKQQLLSLFDQSPLISSQSNYSLIQNSNCFHSLDQSHLISSQSHYPPSFTTTTVFRTTIVFTLWINHTLSHHLINFSHHKSINRKPLTTFLLNQSINHKKLTFRDMFLQFLPRLATLLSPLLLREHLAPSERTFRQ
jgi:hypothetical protein